MRQIRAEYSDGNDVPEGRHRHGCGVVAAAVVWQGFGAYRRRLGRVCYPAPPDGVRT